MNSTASRIATLLGSASLLTMASAMAAQAQQVAQAQMAQAVPEAVPEQVLITGSLIHGAAAVGVPVTNLSPQDFAQTGALTASDLFRTFPQANVVPGSPAVAPYLPQNTERYPGARPNAVKLVANEPVSTLSLDVDTAAYANVRRYLNQNTLPPVDAVRVEEMINYFDYAYMMPRDRDAPFAPSVVVYPSPWNPDTQILHVGIKGYDIPRSERPKANLVFLIDTSGSMSSPDKLPLVKRSFQMLVEQPKPEDPRFVLGQAGLGGNGAAPAPGRGKDNNSGLPEPPPGGG